MRAAERGSTVATAPTRRARGVDTKTRIMGAARDCFAERGYGATTNRLIAQRAGVTTAAVYHHYGQKRDLMFAIQRSVAAAVFEQMADAVHPAATCRDRVASMFGTLQDAIRADPGQVAFGLVAREEANRYPELAGLMEDHVFVTLFARVSGDGVASGEIASGDSPLVDGVLSVLALGIAAVASDMDADTHKRVTALCSQLFAGDVRLVAPGPFHRSSHDAREHP